MKKILVFIIIALVGVAVGVGATVGVQALFFKNTKTAATPAPKKAGPIVSVGEFTVNLQGGFLKVNVDVEATDAKAAEELKTKQSFLRDRVNTVLFNRPISDVKSADGLEKLKKELATKLNEIADNKIQEVLFKDFVYQE